MYAIIYIFALIFLITISLYIYACIETKRMNRTIKKNGVEIVLSKEEYQEYLKEEKQKEIERESIKKQKRLEKKKAFEHKCLELNTAIQNKIDSSDNFVTKKVLSEILKIKVQNKEDYEKKVWLFNDGNLRTNKEISTKWHQENYDAERHITSIIAFMLPFIAIMLLILILSGNPGLLFFGLIPAGIAGIFGATLGHSANITSAELYGIPSDDPRVLAEKTAKNIAIASGVATTIHAVRKTKNAVKDIANVDGWKEMK